MYCQGRSPQRSKAFLFLTALLGCLVASSSFSQEVSTQEASFTNDESGRVVGLTYFGRAGLRQSVPQDLSSLTSVEISYGAILTQEDIEFLSSLHNVKELSFGGNLDDEYVIIEGSLSPLASLKRLEHLFLCKRDMCDSDLGFIGELPNLQYLEFLAGPNPIHKQGSSVTDACAESIRRAKSLRWLRIDHGNFSDRFIDAITQDLRELESLDLSSEHLTDRSLQWLSERCSNLRSIDLWSKNFTDQGVSHLAKAKQLEEIWLECPLLTNESVRVLSELKNLHHLLITTPSVSNDVVEKVAKLSALQILCLRNTPLSDEQFAMFAHHPKLESIFANGRDLTKEKVLQVIATMPQLNHMELSYAHETQIAVKRFLADRKSAVEN